MVCLIRGLYSLPSRRRGIPSRLSNTHRRQSVEWTDVDDYDDDYDLWEDDVKKERRRPFFFFHFILFFTTIIILYDYQKGKTMEDICCKVGVGVDFFCEIK